MPAGTASPPHPPAFESTSLSSSQPYHQYFYVMDLYHKCGLRKNQIVFSGKNLIVKRADLLKWYVQDLLFSDIVPALSYHRQTSPDALFKKKEKADRRWEKCS